MLKTLWAKLHFMRSWVLWWSSFSNFTFNVVVDKNLPTLSRFYSVILVHHSFENSTTNLSLWTTSLFTWIWKYHLTLVFTPSPRGCMVRRFILHTDVPTESGRPNRSREVDRNFTRRRLKVDRQSNKDKSITISTTTAVTYVNYSNSNHQFNHLQQRRRPLPYRAVIRGSEENWR